MKQKRLCLWGKNETILLFSLENGCTSLSLIKICDLRRQKLFEDWLKSFYQASICWSSRHLQHVFSVTILRLPRRLEVVLKTSWKTKNCYAEDVFKTSSRRVLKTSGGHILKTTSRRLGGKQNVYWWYLYLTNLNLYLTDLCFTNLHLTNLRWIQNALLRTQ